MRYSNRIIADSSSQWINEVLFWLHLLVIASGIVMGVFLPWWLAVSVLATHRLHLKLFNGCIFSSFQKKLSALDETQDYLQQLFKRLFNITLLKYQVKIVDRLIITFSLLVIILANSGLSNFVLLALFIIVALYGAYSCIKLIIDHSTKKAALTELCDLNSCNEVQQTNYSSILGIPVEYLGVGYFTVLIILVIASNIISGSTQIFLSNMQLLIIISGLFVSITFIWLQFKVIRSLCATCMNIHGASLFIFLLQTSKMII